MSLPINYKTFFKEILGSNGHEYWGSKAAGCIFVAKDTGRILIAQRGPECEEPYSWGTWGGKIDGNETPKQAVEREIEEETGVDGHYKLAHLYTYKDGNFEYHNYLVIIPFEFQPKLNWENDNGQWVEFGEWPTPLHFGMEELLKHAGSKIKKVVDLIKKKQHTMLETMDAPPAIIQPSAQNPSNVNVIDSKKMTDAYIVIATIWGEARGEGEVGMQAVLNVIMNRSHGNFNNARSVVLKPKQFSLWNKVADPEQYSKHLAQTQRTINKHSADHLMYVKAVELVDKAMKGQLPDITGGATFLPDITGGATFYFNSKLATPSWANKMIKTKTIGNHEFYKLKSHISK